jgi:hypothetical protein
MTLKLRPTGLGIDKDRPDYTVVTGEWPHLRDPRRSRRSALVLVDDRQRSDDTLGSRGDVRGSQGAISKELGRLEGMGKVGRDAVVASSIRDGNILLKYFLNHAPLDCSSHSFGHQPDDI